MKDPQSKMLAPVKVSELEGARLNYWVAKALGMQRVEIRDRWGLFTNIAIYSEGNRPEGSFRPARFSTRWEEGGPIIERQGITLYKPSLDPEWQAYIWTDAVDTPKFLNQSPSPLIAAMRCFVASKFGEEVG